MRTAVLCAAALGVLLGAQPSFAQQGGDGSKQLPAAAGARDAEVPPEQPAGQGGKLEGLPIYSSDNQKVGAVKSVEKNSDGSVGTLQAEIEGFLGLGTSSVRLTPDQFKHTGDSRRALADGGAGARRAGRVLQEFRPRRGGRAVALLTRRPQKRRALVGGRPTPAIRALGEARFREGGCGSHGSQKDKPSCV